MKKIFFAVFLLVIIALAIFAFVYRKNLAGVRPVFQTPQESIVDILENTATQTPEASIPLQKVDFPLVLPEGFQISLLAKNLSGARVMALDSRGNLWVSRMKEGVITYLDIENGVVVSQHDFFKGLNNPHGLAFDPENPNTLYIAEEDKISFVNIYTAGEPPERPFASDYERLNMGLVASSLIFPYKIVDLPNGGRHESRTLLFDKDGTFFVSIGSTCDVCNEKDDRISTIMKVVVEDTSSGPVGRLEHYAKGLRNSVFMVTHPNTGKIWATEMGRDNLGDNIPPDEVNIIEEGNTSTGLSIKNYGWPNCYGKNIHDTKFDKNTYIRNPCMEPFETPSHIDLQAHSAVLGLAFVPSDSDWPQEYWNNLFLAYHGSWNRTVPTGYKVVRYQLDEKGNPKNGPSFREEDFVSGWLKGGKESYGRPVDLLVQKDGSMFISDDKAGLIYKVSVKK